MQNQKLVIIVDPISTGGAIAAEIEQRGFTVVRVWSDEVGELKTHIPDVAKNVDWLATFDYSHFMSVPELAAQIQMLAIGNNATIFACMVGGESGVVLSDELSEHLAVRTNGIVPSRRNKSWQQKQIGSAGLRATREASGTTVHDPQVAGFLASEHYPIIVKPTESAGSDGVKKCGSREEAEAHFELLMASQQRLGSAGAAVICQEFLAGSEYVVDHVSRDGVDKTVMIWRYDRAAANGGDFVMFNMKPVPSDAPEAKQLIEYTRGVINALGLHHGPSHAEVMLTADGPCLVEMNCRAHGCDGTWMHLCRALTGGFSQVDAAVDAMLDAGRFEALPDVYCDHGPFKAAGQLVQLVSHDEGTIVSTKPLEAVRQMASFQYLQLSEAIAPGKTLERTVDLFTGVGFVILCHASHAAVEKDVAAIRSMEAAGRLVELLDDSSADEDDEIGQTLSKVTGIDLLASVRLDERSSARAGAELSSEVSREASHGLSMPIGA